MSPSSKSTAQKQTNNRPIVQFLAIYPSVVWCAETPFGGRATEGVIDTTKGSPPKSDTQLLLTGL